MAEIKTKPNNASVREFLKSITPKEKQEDGFKLLKIFEDVTGERAKMWGTAIIGFGMYHYESDRSSQKGDWPMTAFSPRKQNLTVYIMPGFKEYGELLKKLGRHKTTVSCLYIRRLSDVDTKVLAKIIKLGFMVMKKKYN